MLQINGGMVQLFLFAFCGQHTLGILVIKIVDYHSTTYMTKQDAGFVSIGTTQTRQDKM